jgi:hypothetical protein
MSSCPLFCELTTADLLLSDSSKYSQPRWEPQTTDRWLHGWCACPCFYGTSIVVSMETELCNAFPILLIEILQAHAILLSSSILCVLANHFLQW